jgi:hypothetical protein
VCIVLYLQVCCGVADQEDGPGKTGSRLLSGMKRASQHIEGRPMSNLLWIFTYEKKRQGSTKIKLIGVETSVVVQLPD